MSQRTLAADVGTFLRLTILWGGAIVFFGIAAFLALSDKTASSASSAGFATILLFLANLDRIEYFKGFGLEAKTRELDKKIDEATRVLEELRHLSRMSGAFFMDTVCKQGRWDSGNSSAESYRMKREVEAQLRSIGIEDSEVEAVVEPWVRWTAFDLAVVAVEKLREEFYRIKTGANESQREAVALFEAEINSLHKLKTEELAASVKKLFTNVPLVDEGRLRSIYEDAKPWIGELKFVVENRSLPDQSKWLSRPVGD